MFHSKVNPGGTFSWMKSERKVLFREEERMHEPLGVQSLWAGLCLAKMKLSSSWCCHMSGGDSSRGSETTDVGGWRTGLSRSGLCDQRRSRGEAVRGRGPRKAPWAILSCSSSTVWTRKKRKKMGIGFFLFCLHIKGAVLSGPRKSGSSRENLEERRGLLLPRPEPVQGSPSWRASSSAS